MYVADKNRYDSMQYRRTGRSGLKLPAVSLGLWHNFGGVDQFDNSRAMLRRAFDLGITHFDLANNYGPPYGSAEETFGQILKKDFLPYRDELIISTKAGWICGRDRMGSRLAQIHAGQPRPEPEAHGPCLRRHLLSSPSRSRDADGRVDGALDTAVRSGGRFTRAFRPITPSKRRKRSRFCATSERPA